MYVFYTFHRRTGISCYYLVVTRKLSSYKQYFSWNKVGSKLAKLLFYMGVKHGLSH